MGETDHIQYSVGVGTVFSLFRGHRPFPEFCCQSFFLTYWRGHEDFKRVNILLTKNRGILFGLQQIYYPRGIFVFKGFVYIEVVGFSIGHRLPYLRMAVLNIA